ncbi:ComEC/Rec2 family competence protein [Allostreptomyces psammosilenae]|uniref:Competence protein ComEC n=1 Tax=Allostreptomyces psammosilenae TaxID=1892865 RepID=A0A852ZWA3_9ACTN|nr:ComEC/Rec2 family competence protein [Allostreptomyces psammosilenae]NYI06656.1 competence protein ComEC [Allostreptomyces psammosilenae]
MTGLLPLPAPATAVPRPAAAASRPPAAPTDLRLALPAGVAWAAAAAALSGTPGAAWAAAGVLLAAAVVAWAVARPGRSAVRRRAGPPRRGLTVVGALLCAAVVCAACAARLTTVRGGPLAEPAARRATVTAWFTVTADPERSPAAGAPLAEHDQATLEVRVERVALPGEGPPRRLRAPVLLVVTGGPTGAWLDLQPSTRVEATVQLAEAGPGEHLAAVAFAHGPPRVLAAPHPVQRAAETFRAGLRAVTDRLHPHARALLPGLVVGDTSRMPDGLTEAFRRTDLLHLTAVSGTNLTILLAVVVGPGGLSRAARSERGGPAGRLGLPLRWVAALGTLLVVAFVVLCRPQPSVLRAAAMGLIGMAALALGRRRQAVPAVAGATLALLLLDPWLSRSWGFALSVAATTALVTLGRRWGEALCRRGWPGPPARLVGGAAAVQVCCAPLAVVFTGQASVVGVVCNLLVEPAVAPATVLGFLALGCAPFAPAVGGALAWLAAWPARWIAAVAEQGAALPGATVAWPSGWAGGALLAVVATALVAVARRAARRPPVAALAAVALLLALVRPQPVTGALTAPLTGWPPAGWRLVACDVGQGDALVVRAGEGSALVIDAGPDPEAVDDCLRDLGVRSVPLVILTHPHADHVAGLPGVLRGRAVGAVQVPPPPTPEDRARWWADDADDAAEELVARWAEEAGVPLLLAAAGERRAVGGVSWRVLWPRAGPDGTLLSSAQARAAPGHNNSSVALEMEVDGLRVVALGDLEPEAQRLLMREHPELPAADVLKVAHHGSGMQEHELTGRLAPRVAVISCGAGNGYGHPAPTTLRALEAVGATVLRTDRHGDVAVAGGGDAPRAVIRGSSASDDRG